MAKNTSDQFSCFDFSVAEGIARIHLNRPDVHNRFDEPLHRELSTLVAQLPFMPEIKVLIISAEGKSFSAGGDMHMMIQANGSKQMRDRLAQEARTIFDGLTGLSFPVITAVQGSAIGLGATIVALSDIVVAWREAKIADPHVMLGLVAGDGGVTSWAQSIGLNRAKRYLLTGDRITAAEAHAMGMVTDLVEAPDDARLAAEAIAGRIAALPRDGVAGTKRAFSLLSRQYAGAVFELSLAYEMEALGGVEVRATVQGMLDKK